MARRTRPLLVPAAALALALLPACSDDGDSEAFCERLGETEPLGDVFSVLDPSDPAGYEEAVQDTLDEFRELEADAPGEVRDDVARLRQAVELIVEAVEDNPDDLPSAREAISGELDELSGLAQAGEAVEAYARDECGIELVPSFEGGSESQGEGQGQVDPPRETTTTTG